MCQQKTLCEILNVKFDFYFLWQNIIRIRIGINRRIFLKENNESLIKTILSTLRSDIFELGLYYVLGRIRIKSLNAENESYQL